MKAKKFIKSADTNVTVQESMESIRALVRRHGAVGFGVVEDYKTGKSVVQFALVQGEQHVPIHIPLDVQKVHDLMYPPDSDNNRWKNNPDIHRQRKEQAERTAWRQLYLIVDAVLTATTLGVMTITDAFLAHMMVVDEKGMSQRMGDFVLRGAGALGPGVRALLPASTGSSNGK